MCFMIAMDPREEQWNREVRLFFHDRIFAKVLEPIVPQWLKPNHLTVFRMILTPFVLWFLQQESYVVGVPLFLFAAVTDTWDGSLARTRKQITSWGVMYDPIADKLLIGSVLFLIVLEHVNRFLGLSLLAVEVVIIIGGLYGKLRGDIRPANWWGKAKMVTEVVGIFLLLMALWFRVDLLIMISVKVLAVALIVAIVSILSRL